jgi:hypothetical protein
VIDFDVIYFFKKQMPWPAQQQKFAAQSVKLSHS